MNVRIAKRSGKIMTNPNKSRRNHARRMAESYIPAQVEHIKNIPLDAAPGLDKAIVIRALREYQLHYVRILASIIEREGNG